VLDYAGCEETCLLKIKNGIATRLEVINPVSKDAATWI